jgi:hypothetical protein
MNKQDLTMHSENELSLWVFNDEGLYRMRYRKGFKDTLDELFEYTDKQWQVLVEDLESDLLEDQGNE